jgi:ADP-ribose pyrophosphatase
MSDAETIASRTVFRGNVVELAVESVRLPNGSVCELELIHHRGAAAALPVDANGEVLLVRQYRHATREWLLEVPAGKLDGGEAPEICAMREIEEETGYRARDLVSMGWIWTTPGFTDEKIWLFLATGLTRTQQNLQADEALSVERHRLERAVAMAARGEITDAKSVCALLRARDLLL